MEQPRLDFLWPPVRVAGRELGQKEADSLLFLLEYCTVLLRQL